MAITKDLQAIRKELTRLVKQTEKLVEALGKTEKQKSLKTKTKEKDITLTKAKIVEAVAEQNGYPKHQSSEIVETLLEIIKRTLESDKDVLVRGFGKFCVKEKRKRRGRNPATGEDMMLAPRKVVTFRCSRRLRDKVNGY